MYQVLVIDAGADDIHLIAVQRRVGRDAPLSFRPRLDAARDLPVSALHPVAQANRAHAAILIAGPDVPSPSDSNS